MILLLIACAILVLGIGAIIICEANGYMVDGFWGALLAFLLAASIVVIMLCPVVRSDFKNSCIKTQKEYEELMLYKELVNESDNERIRYDYYQKIENWNTRYEKAGELAQGEQFQNWFGGYWCNKFYGTGPIEFELKGE